MLRKRRMKKLYDLTYFYTDKSDRFEFYFRRNWLDQFDVCVYDINNRSNRWFMVTPAVFYTMLHYVDHGELKAFKLNVMDAAKPQVALELKRNQDYTIIGHTITHSGLMGDTVVAKIGAYNVADKDNTEDVLLLKRIATVPNWDNSVLGMDTLEIPVDGVKKLLKVIKKKYFKGLDLSTEINKEENNE